MNTDITALIAAAIVDGRALEEQRKAEAEAAEAAREKAARARRAEGWADPLALVKAALPEWMHPYTSAPDCEHRHLDGYAHEYAPVAVRLPGLAPIDAYTDISFGYGGDATRGVALVVRSAEIDADADESAICWRTHRYYRSSNDSNSAIPAADWPRAIAQAADERRRGDELLERECERSDTGRPPSPTPVPPTTLERLAEALGDLIAERGWCDGSAA